MGLFGHHANNNSSAVDRSIARSVKLVKGNGPAIALTHIENTGGIDLRKKTEAAHISLEKNDIGGIRAQVMVVVDHSGSMYGEYDNGLVQDMVERFLGFGMAVDVDGEIPVVPFDFKAKNAVNVNISNYHNVVKDKIFKPNDMGSTNLTDALEKVRDEAKKTDAPLFVAIVTDGEPDDQNSAAAIIKDLARYPVFIKFLAVRKVRFLEDLDDMSDSERLLDNVDTKEYTDMSTVTDQQFANDMADEWDSWVKLALAAGVLTQ